MFGNKGKGPQNPFERAAQTIENPLGGNNILPKFEQSRTQIPGDWQGGLIDSVIEALLGNKR